MRPAKPMNSTMRPNRAGFAKLKPRPPNSCFATTMATKAPMMAIHSGMVAGRLKARIMPVTTAEKSPTGTGFFITTQYSASKPTQAATVTPVTSSARAPKISVLATSAGSSAMHTLSISPRVLVWLVIWGDAVTISFLLSIVISSLRSYFSATRPWPDSSSG